MLLYNDEEFAEVLLNSDRVIMIRNECAKVIFKEKKSLKEMEDIQETIEEDNLYILTKIYENENAMLFINETLMKKLGKSVKEYLVEINLSEIPKEPKEQKDKVSKSNNKKEKFKKFKSKNKNTTIIAPSGGGKALRKEKKSKNNKFKTDVNGLTIFKIK